MRDAHHLRLAVESSHLLFGAIPDFSSGWLRSRMDPGLGMDVSRSASLMGNLHFRLADAGRSAQAQVRAYYVAPSIFSTAGIVRARIRKSRQIVQPEK